MKTRTKLSAALLATVSVAMLPSAASADELSALKAQLEALQTKVDTMESSASSYNLPAGTSLITGRRGVADYNFAANPTQLAQDWAGGENSGYTIAITPTADMPAPVAEITVSGYVSSWVIYGIDGHVDTEAGAFAPYDWTDGDTHLHINSRGSIRVRSRVDTAVGQVRTDIELRGEPGGTAAFRYAWGEWDMTPNWTLGAGSFFQTASLANVPTTVNSSGAIGTYNVARPDQVRLTYRDGPLSWAVALEEPTFESTTAMPNIATSISYDVPGGHNVQFIAQVSDLSAHGANDDLGWEIGGSAGINLADIATLVVGGTYGVGGTVNTPRDGSQSLQGITGYGTCAVNFVDDNNDLCSSWGISAGIGMGFNDVTTFNVFFGYEDNLSTFAAPAATDYDEAWVVGANVIWQPVRQLRMGWEVNYGEADTMDPAVADLEALTLMWHTRFFF